MPPAPKTRVLIVDDSAIVRKILSESLSGEADIEIVGTAPDPIIALEKIHRLKPDVLTLDIEMPRMDGLTFLKSLMSTEPMPVILVSSLAESSCQIAMEALRLGAVDVFAKPSGPYSVGELRSAIASRIRAAARARLRRSTETPSAPPPLVKPSGDCENRVVAIGASTGGTEAVADVLHALPAEVPPILITQHIPAVFSRAFADRLNRQCRMEVREAVDGDQLRPGLALVAPGNFHMILTRTAGQHRIAIKDGPMVCYQRPSVDVLFTSVAEFWKGESVGVILTGMGRDGAQGLAKMKQAGARTIAQDESTSVVYGMPREAARLGAADQILPLGKIAAAILAA